MRETWTCRHNRLAAPYTTLEFQDFVLCRIIFEIFEQFLGRECACLFQNVGTVTKAPSKPHNNYSTLFYIPTQ